MMSLPPRVGKSPGMAVVTRTSFLRGNAAAGQSALCFSTNAELSACRAARAFCKCSGWPPLPWAEEGTTNLEAGSSETGFPACWRASLDPNAGVCVVFGLEAKNSLFLKEELGLPTCASTPAKPSKPTVVSCWQPQQKAS